MPKPVRNMLCQQLRRSLIAQMSVIAANPPFQISRIRPHHQHVFVMVGLQYQMIRPGDVAAELFCHVSGIRNEAEVDFSVLHAIAHIVRTVMRHIERRNFKTVQLQGLPLLQKMYVFCFQFRICTIITLDSVVYKFGGIDRKSILIRQAPDSFDVVCMIMRNQHGLYLFQGKPVSMKMFFQCSYPNSGINQYSIIF